MMRLVVPKKYDSIENYTQLKHEICKKGVNLIVDYINEKSNNFEVTKSVLYNAYTETKFAEYYSENDMGFKNLYADSGGLQVITQGKSLTDEIKQKVYQVQDASDISFCFDEIPVEKKCSLAVAGGASERSNVSSKHFDYSRFKDCAKKTAENVLIQLNTLESSSVSYIVQGNTIKDMVEWFDIGASVLGVENIKKLKGIALADTCMGNGTLESCDMMITAKIIFDKYPDLHKQIHLLGIGSVARLLPLFMMLKSGLIDPETVISFDSSTNAMSFIMGKVGFIESGKRPKHDVFLVSYKQFFEFMKPVFSQYCDDYNTDELAQFLLDNNKQASAAEDSVDENHKYYKIARCFVPLYCVWTNVGLFHKLDIMCSKRTKQYDRLFELLRVKSVDEYYQWRVQHGHKIISHRMDRKGSFKLESLFGEVI